MSTLSQSFNLTIKIDKFATFYIYISPTTFNRRLSVRPEKFQFREKGQNRNFDYKIVISVKNPEFILYILDDETDFTVGIVS